MLRRAPCYQCTYCHCGKEHSRGAVGKRHWKSALPSWQSWLDMPRGVLFAGQSTTLRHYPPPRRPQVPFFLALPHIDSPLPQRPRPAGNTQLVRNQPVMVLSGIIFGGGGYAAARVDCTRDKALSALHP